MFNVERLRLGDPFDLPTDPDKLDLMVGWFWERIILIVTKENHTLKFDGTEQVLNILREAAEVEQINVTFYECNGWWNIESAATKEDILNLPRIAMRFSRIYRHHAREYATGENKSVHELMEGLKDGRENSEKD